MTLWVVAGWLAPWRHRVLQEQHERELAARRSCTPWGVDTLAPFVLRADKSYFFGPDDAALVGVPGGRGRRDRLRRSDRAARRVRRAPAGRSSLMRTSATGAWRSSALRSAGCRCTPGTGCTRSTSGTKRWSSRVVLARRPRDPEDQAIGAPSRSAGFQARVLRPTSSTSRGRRARGRLRAVARRRGRARLLDGDGPLFRLGDGAALSWSARARGPGRASCISSGLQPAPRCPSPRCAAPRQPDGLIESLICATIAWAPAPSRRVSLNFAPFPRLLAPAVELSEPAGRSSPALRQTLFPAGQPLLFNASSRRAGSGASSSTRSVVTCRVSVSLRLPRRRTCPSWASVEHRGRAAARPGVGRCAQLGLGRAARCRLGAPGARPAPADEIVAAALSRPALAHRLPRRARRLGALRRGARTGSALAGAGRGRGQDRCPRTVRPPRRGHSLGGTASPSSSRPAGCCCSPSRSLEERAPAIQARVAAVVVWLPRRSASLPRCVRGHGTRAGRGTGACRGCALRRWGRRDESGLLGRPVAALVPLCWRRTGGRSRRCSSVSASVPSRPPAPRHCSRTRCRSSTGPRRLPRASAGRCLRGATDRGLRARRRGRGVAGPRALGRAQDDDSVSVAVQRARPERTWRRRSSPARRARRSVLAARPRARAERLDADRELGERVDVSNAAVDHQTRPAVLERKPGNVVADERAAKRAAAVDDEARARSRALPTRCFTSTLSSKQRTVAIAPENPATPPNRRS